VSLPEPVPPKLAAYLAQLGPADRELVEQSLTLIRNGKYATPAELIAVALTEAGYPIGETIIKTYRRKILNRQEG
jgi:hypothetical protein